MVDVRLTPETHRIQPFTPQRLLLACGVAYGLLYVIANDVIAASLYDGYSRMDQAVSELSAQGAPSRACLVAVAPIFSLLLIGFGVGVRSAGRHHRPLRLTGDVVIAQGVTSVAWLWFPMSARQDIVAGDGGANDVGHLVLTGLSIAFFVAEIGLGAWALGPRVRHWRWYSAAAVAISLVFGMLTSAQAANMADGRPSPLMGFYERVNMGVWLLWMATVAAILLRERGTESTPTRLHTQAETP